MRKNGFCIVLLVMALACLGLAIAFHPEEFTVVNCFCYYFMMIVYVFMPMGLNIADNRDLGASCLLALCGIFVGIYAGVGFWYLPLVAAVLPVIHFIIRSLEREGKWNILTIGDNVFYLSLLSYCFCLAVKIGVVGAWEYFFG